MVDVLRAARSGAGMRGCRCGAGCLNGERERDLERDFARGGVLVAVVGSGGDGDGEGDQGSGSPMTVRHSRSISSSVKVSEIASILGSRSNSHPLQAIMNCSPQLKLCRARSLVESARSLGWLMRAVLRRGSRNSRARSPEKRASVDQFESGPCQKRM